MTGHPRNLIVIRTDSQRPDTIGAFGATVVTTPNVDWLAAEGTLFEQAYCAQPVCAPSRASVLTGLYPHAHGVAVNNIALSRDVPTIAELLRPAGYVCGHIGLWHQGDELTPQRGFEDFWVSTEEQYTLDHARQGYSSYHHFLLSRGYVPTDPHHDGMIFGRTAAAHLPEEVGKPSFIAAEAIRFLQGQGGRGDAPFLLFVNFLEPHPPYTGPLDGLYKPEDVSLPPSWYQEMERTVPARYRVRQQEYTGRNPYVSTNDERGWRELVARYWGNCTLVDRYAGRILDALRELHLWDDTVVVYTSDHGDMMGDHRLLAKGVPYEGAVHVPLIVHVPDTEARRISTPVSQVDLVPTLFEALAQPVPAHLQGTSLLPLLEGSASTEDAEVVIEWNGYERHAERVPPAMRPKTENPQYRLGAVDVRTIRVGRWKLSVHGTDEYELYDLESDPHELHNAATDPASACIVETLHKRLHAWQQRTGDRVLSG
jgi:arylsulfatase A-like enzyme